MKKSKKQPTEALLSMVCILVLCVIGYYFIQPDISLKKDVVEFVKCTDGDTAHLRINDIDEPVRFLAIDTPETVKPGSPVQPYGKEASDYTCNAIKEANQITLEYESTNKTDKYGRILAWVYVDGVLLQQELVEKGLAKVAYLYGDYKYTNDLQQVENKAKEAQLGLWENH